MTPVLAKARLCGKDIFSTGRFKSAKPAITRHHFIAGAQKNIVFGPAGWSINAFHDETSGGVAAAASAFPAFSTLLAKFLRALASSKVRNASATRGTIFVCLRLFSDECNPSERQ
eukprot:CAMPEP_0184341214 /NCGR_PEP_ID=MMETSP1089-20130417/9833_1 /TAXON_ID=38269 ORGANISM="Gloeochaete wittrockiana, Strain SAG46.84" /NCGR_SAMPLE_ID=MMETSP1089 /ASSEMBLY_ACC=CAM_ASM_000445 /LENGTH=114 /DNA_ID=CAMNT_0026669385 /DNA_START=145 /DNA_END=486 /DNA_ORIENTATION=+